MFEEFLAYVMEETGIPLYGILILGLVMIFPVYFLVRFIFVLILPPSWSKALFFKKQGLHVKPVKRDRLRR